MHGSAKEALGLSGQMTEQVSARGASEILYIPWDWSSFPCDKPFPLDRGDHARFEVGAICLGWST